MGLDQYAQVRNKKIDFSKVYSKDYKPQRDGFVWRKHARLQTFMQNKFFEQNPNLGDVDFNCKDLIIDKKIIEELRQEIKSGYHFSFCEGGCFWGHQFQEDSVKEYKKQDLQFCDWVLTELEKGNKVVYSCSW